MRRRLSLLAVCTLGVTSGCNCRSPQPTPDAGRVTVTVAITGSGAVESGGAVACSSEADAGACALSVGPGALSLSAVPAQGFIFSGWVCGGTASSEPRLELELSQDIACTVTFVRRQRTLRVTVDEADGGARGAVTSSPGDLSCGAGSTRCSGAFDEGVEVTLTAAPSAEAGAVAFFGWSGDCAGAAATTKVAMAADTSCTATFRNREVTLRGQAGPHGTVAPASTTLVPSDGSDGGVTLTATPGESSRLAGWSGTFSSGSGVARGCEGSGPSVTVSIIEASPGAVYDCTASFQTQAVLTVRVVPGASTSQATLLPASFALVSSPCEVAGGSSSCEALVDTGEVTLSTVEAVNELQQDVSRFVRWRCSNGWTSTSRTAAVTITQATTCVAQYYGLWSRSYGGPSALGGSPSAVPLGPGVVDGLPSAASSYLIDFPVNNEVMSQVTLVAADDREPPTTMDWATTSNLGGWSVSANGDDAPALVGWTHGQGWGRAGLFGAYAVTRDERGEVSSLGRVPFVVLSPQPGEVTSEFYDSVLLRGRKDAQGRHVLGGFATLAGEGEGIAWLETSAWVILMDGEGRPSASTRFRVPSRSAAQSECADRSMAAVTDLLWDPDPGNAGGVVVLGAAFDRACQGGATCPGGASREGFVVRLNARLEVLAVRLLASEQSPEQAPVLSFEPRRILPDLSGSGYAVIGQYETDVVFFRLSSELAMVGEPQRLAVAEVAVEAPPMAVETNVTDALVDTVGHRYVVLADAAFEAGRDVVVMTLQASGQPVANEGWRFGAAGLDEWAGAIVRPSEGGFLFTGRGPVAVDTSESAWVTRADDAFQVPLVGGEGGIARSTPLTYASLTPIRLTAEASPCAPWVDGSLPVTSELTTTPQSFEPGVTVHAP